MTTPSMDVWISPDGQHQLINSGNSYRAALSLYDRFPHLPDLRANHVINSGKAIGAEDFLLVIGYIRIVDHKITCGEQGLSENQTAFIQLYADRLSARVLAQLVERGFYTSDLSKFGTVEYFTDILSSIENRYEQLILDTDGNTHDFNMNRSNIKYALRKLDEASSSMPDGDDRDKAIRDAVFSARHGLLILQRLAESEVRRVRMHERLIKLEGWKRDGKSYSYLDKKAENIRGLLGMEVTFDEVPNPSI